jgi:hypothetical protein
MFSHKSYVILIFIFSSILSINSTFSADEESKETEKFKTLESTLTDSAMRTLGYSKPDFSNVGRLSKVYKLPFGKITYDIGSVVLLDKDQKSSVRTCLSAAHCFEELKERSAKMKNFYYYMDILIPKYYEVTFESDNVPEYSCTVTKHVMHPEYSTGHDSADIAILCLDKTVPHLTGLQPYYTFRSDLEQNINSDEYKFFRPLLRQLFYVGYGRSGNDSDYFNTKPDGKRRASISLLHFCLEDNVGEEIYSIPIKSKFNFKEPNLVVLNQREPMLFEIGMRSGMSGGATLNHNLALVGINTASRYQDISSLDKIRREKDKFMKKHATPINVGLYSFYVYTLLGRKRVFLNIGISLTMFSLANLRTNDMYPGARCISTAIEPHKKWIEEWRERFQQED